MGPLSLYVLSFYQAEPANTLILSGIWGLIPISFDFTQQPQIAEEEASLGDLFSKLVGDMQSLVKKVSAAGEKAGEWVGQAREKTSQTADQIAHQARRHSRQTRRKARRMVRENPLGMAGALFAVGSALGFLIPQTRMENEWTRSSKNKKRPRKILNPDTPAPLWAPTRMLRPSKPLPRVATSHCSFPLSTTLYSLMSAYLLRPARRLDQHDSWLISEKGLDPMPRKWHWIVDAAARQSDSTSKRNHRTAREENHMNFRDHLKQKITIDELSARVARSLRDPDSGKNFDKETMRQLLSMGPYRHQREREMDLFVQEKGSRKGTILVLDNGLGIYRTTMEDVILRKNPTVKEMVSIRNAIKILNDKDVVISRKVDSVKAVHQVLMDELNLDYEAQDIEAMAKAGRDALSSGEGAGGEESLRLFAELLDFVALPKAFRAQDQATQTWGRIQSTASGAYVAAPVVIYHRTGNSLKLVQGPVDTREKGDMEKYQLVLTGEVNADIEGAEVFGWLQHRVLSEKPTIKTTWQQI